MVRVRVVECSGRVRISRVTAACRAVTGPTSPLFTVGYDFPRDGLFASPSFILQLSSASDRLRFINRSD